MTPQETQLLQDFLNQLVQAKGISKDPQADALIAKAVAEQPDAAYLLAQRALLVEHALTDAKAQIAQLQTELQSSRTTGSSTFLDNQYAWGRPSSDVPRTTPPAPPVSSPVQAPVAAPRPSFLSGGVGSVLGSVATTAAGVAAGAFLFQGIENLMGHHGSGFLGQNSQPNSLTENVTVNNYYSGDSNPAEDDNFLVADEMGRDDDGGDSSWV